MGRQKLLLQYSGLPLAAHALAAAVAGGCQPVVMVVGEDGEPILRALGVERLARVQVVKSGNPDAGQSSSLQAGLQELPSGILGAMVLLGDQPLLSPALVRRLLDAFRRTPEAFLVPRHAGRRGNPVCIPAAWFPRVLELRGDTGARPLLAHPESQVVEYDVDDPAVVTDVDTPEDYARLLAGCLSQMNQPS